MGWTALIYVIDFFKHKTISIHLKKNRIISHRCSYSFVKPFWLSSIHIQPSDTEHKHQHAHVVAQHWVCTQHAPCSFSTEAGKSSLKPQSRWVRLVQRVPGGSINVYCVCNNPPPPPLLLLFSVWSCSHCCSSHLTWLNTDNIYSFRF